MKVIIIADFHFTDSTELIESGTGKYVTVIQMPSSPAGTTAIGVYVDKFPVYIPVRDVIWNAMKDAFVVHGTVNIPEHLKERIPNDANWHTFDEFVHL